MGPPGRKTLLAPIHFIFSILTKDKKVVVWLYDQIAFRIEGNLRGFDEFMNLVLDNAVEVRLATKSVEEKRRPLGQIMLRGDNVTVIQPL